MDSSVRDLGMVAWNDPYAWVESMDGRQWQTTISKEIRRFDTIVEHYVDRIEKKTVEEELVFARASESGRSFLVRGEIEVWIGGTLSVSWAYEDEEDFNHVTDLAVDRDGNVWDIADSGNGSESYTLCYWGQKSTKKSVIWKHETVGPSLLVIGNTCYFLEAKKSLWYWRLMCCDAKTGKNVRVLYEEVDPRWNLSLIRGEGHTGYLVRENSGLQQAFFLKNGVLKTMEHMGFFVLGGGETNNYFVTDGRGTDNWKAVGSIVTKWELPSANAGIPEHVIPSKGLLVTRKYGMRSLWFCAQRQAPKLLQRGYAQYIFNTWSTHYGEKTVSFRTIRPGSSTQLYFFKNNELTEVPPLMENYAEVKSYFAKHRWATVPYLIVKQKDTIPHTLLVIGYGAYGLPTGINTARWFPLLNRGWAIAFAFVRGGGDHTMAWANAARTWRREASIIDFETVIRDAQKNTGISPYATCVYGRSAGGILVGAAAARQTGTNLFAGLYAEVPYLDLLRTTTNPDLPLTQLEYEEFGEPHKRIEDLVALGSISPMDTIPDDGFPQLFALMRTGGNDKEVLAYEPVKWILKARGTTGADRNVSKILAFERDQGHFVSGSSGLENQASDLGILLAWRRGCSFRLHA